MSTVSEPQTKYHFLPFVKCTDHLIYIGLAVFILLGAVAVAWDNTDSEIGSTMAFEAAAVVIFIGVTVLVNLPKNRIAEEKLAVSKFRAKLTKDSNKINREALENNQKQQKEDKIREDAVAHVLRSELKIPENVSLRKTYEAIKQYLDNFSIKPRCMIVTGSPGVGKTITIKQALNERKGVIHINGEIESSDQVNDEWFKSLILEELGAKGTSLSFKKFLKILSEECRNDPFVKSFVIYADMKVNGKTSAEDLQLIGSRIGSFGRLLSELQCPFIMEISNSHISDSIINSRDLSGIFKEVRVHMTLEEFSLCCYAEIKDEYNDIIFAQGTTINSEEYLNECKDALTEWYFMVGNNPRKLSSVLEKVKESEGGQKQFHKSMFLRVGTRRSRKWVTKQNINNNRN